MANNCDVDADDYCSICWIEGLGSAPAIRLACGHVFHYKCVVDKIKARWNGPRITFSFAECPLCKQQIEYAGKLLEHLLKPVKKLKREIESKALARLQIDNLMNCAEVQEGGH